MISQSGPTGQERSALEYKVALPLGYAVHFHWDGCEAQAQWTPHGPRVYTPGARRKLFKAYRTARDLFAQSIANRAKRPVAVFDRLDETVTVEMVRPAVLQ